MKKIIPANWELMPKGTETFAASSVKRYEEIDVSSQVGISIRDRGGACPVAIEFSSPRTRGYC